MDIERSDNVVLNVTSVGEGPPVVLTHGLVGEQRSFDRVVATLVRRGYRAIRWDLRGHGRSTRGPASWDLLVDDLGAVLDATHVDRAVLVGHEVGATIALSYALRSPSRVAALSLWSVDAGPAPLAHRAHAAMMAAARQVSMRPVTMGLEALWVRKSAIDLDTPAASLYRRIATSQSAAAIAAVVEAVVERPDLRPRVNDLPMPVQVLWGARDLLLRAGAAQEVLQALRHSEGGPIPDAAHLAHLDQPEIVGDLLLGFLERVELDEIRALDAIS